MSVFEVDFELANTFISAMNADPRVDLAPRQVFKAGYSFSAPVPAPKPKILCVSQECAALIGMNSEQAWGLKQDQSFLSFMSGQRQLLGQKSYALAYGGHQFGHWAGQLGDGRALQMGEILVDGLPHMLQLKGAGPTPYSRRGDGLAVLRSSIREFLCSEAMQALGIPTTRALSLALRGEKIWRDLLYDGNPKLEQSAIVCRVAPSFIRFGNFELFARRSELKELDQLLEYVLKTFYPEILSQYSHKEDQMLAFLLQVIYKTAHLVAAWQAIGFVHGVMNTDNMSILGLTIDYGPFGWMETFDPLWTPNTSDPQPSRYAYGQQPSVALWNLWQLATALVQLFSTSPNLKKIIQSVEDLLEGFQEIYDSAFMDKMQLKLGLKELNPYLVDLVFELLVELKLDYTVFFRGMSKIDSYIEFKQHVQKSSYLIAQELTNEQHDDLIEDVWNILEQAWLKENQDPIKRKEIMNAANPAFVLRNYQLYQATEQAEQGDYDDFEALFEGIKSPYKDLPGVDVYSQKSPEWARQQDGCTNLSCSS